MIVKLKRIDRLIDDISTRVNLYEQQILITVIIQMNRKNIKQN